MAEIRSDCIRKPSNPVVKGAAPDGGVRYKVKDGDSWESLAKTHGRTAWALIRFNYPTLPADDKTATLEVNWYLRWYVGCNKVTADGKNYIFSSLANPGIIYVPGAPALNYSRFDKTLTYMYQEMITNAKSNDVAELKLLNGIGKSPVEHGFALLQFRDLVKTNSVWDHKPLLRRLLNLGPDYHFPIDGDPDHEYYYEPSPIVTSLDVPAIAPKNPHPVYRKLKGSWYLYWRYNE